MELFHEQRTVSHKENQEPSLSRDVFKGLSQELACGRDRSASSNAQTQIYGFIGGLHHRLGRSKREVMMFSYEVIAKYQDSNRFKDVCFRNAAQRNNCKIASPFFFFL